MDAEQHDEKTFLQHAERSSCGSSIEGVCLSLFTSLPTVRREVDHALIDHDLTGCIKVSVDRTMQRVLAQGKERRSWR